MSKSAPPPDIMLELPPVDPLEVQIVMVEQAISPEHCRLICDHVNAEYQKNPSVSNPQRTAFTSPVNEKIRHLLHELLYPLLIRNIEPYFGIEVQWWEMPQLLRYVRGGEYGVHSDSENPSKDPNDSGWVKTHDRDISVLIYLNDEFTGGDLYFPDHDITIMPKPGLMVAFPSHHGYRHAAQPTQDGTRYVCASWVAAKGSPRVRPEPPDGSVSRDDYASR